MDNFISPVNHPESYLSGSTTESMIDRAKELGLSYFAATDNGHLTSIIKAYKYAQKKNIKLIAGIELFFKDDNCDIIKNTPSENIKYFKLVLHAKDQEAYQAIVKKASETGKKKIWVLGHDHSAYTWDDLKELSKYNITACTSNIEGMVSKHLLVNRADLGLKYYQKLKDVFGAENFFPTIIPQKQDKYWNTLVKIKAGGKIVHIPASDRVKTDKYDRARAIELTRPNSKHKELKQVFINKMPFKVKKEYQQIESAELENVFQEIPGGDLQTKANKFIMALADKFGDSDKLLMSSYSYYANKDDKVVQDMKLGEEHRVYQPQYMASTEDVVDYLYNELNLTEKIVKKVVNNTYEWAKLFNNFELKYDYRLPIPESDPKKKLVEIIKQTGRMKWDDPVYLNQFKEEFKLLTENGVIDLVPYFLPIVDVYKFYDENGHLTGPSRGSAGGFLISYLLGITHIDPIKYGLYSSRFLTMDRVQQGNFPDIDCDLESRVPLVGDDGNSGYLFNKYGNKAAQISTRTLLRIKSAILDANRFVNGGTVEPEIQAFAKSLPNTPQGTTDYKFVFGYENGDGSHEPGLLELNDELQKYATERPKEWNIVKRALSLSRQNSRHACFAAGTLVDSNGKVDFIDFAPDFADNKPITTWYSGVKDTVIVSMNNGVSIQCTPDHRFIVGNKEIEAKDLKGEFISYKPFKKTSGDTYVDSDLAFSLGWFLNDGSYIKSKNGDERFEFYFTPEKDDEAKERILEWLNKKGYKVTPAKDREDTYRAYNLPLEFKIKQNTQNKRIPKEFWEWDLRPQRNFMSGLFSANGYCLSTRPTVAIKLTSKLLISDIAIWLHSHGISTSCSYSKPRKTMHHNGTYTSKTTATLSIPHFTNKIAFENLVGFIQKYKSDRLRQIIEDARATEYIPNKVKCLHIEESGKTPVWDFNEPLENVGYINGILVHNCAYVVSDRPIEEDVPIFEVGGVKRVTQYEHKHCEWAGLIKYDFLVVSALQDINLCIKYINHKNKSENLQTGHFLHNDEDAYIWDLPEDKEVFDMLGRGETESVFQLNTTSVTPFVKMIKPQSVIDCATITSLVRPGPLDFVNKETGRNMVEEYVERKYGRSEPDIPVMKEMLPETYGVLVFQEQVTKLAKELAGMNAEDAENVRIGVGKKKQHLIDSLKPVFIEGAAKKVGEETATRIWSMMETFARYGFNKSHAVAYSVISYACAFLKYHYPLEWWASVLSNADDKEINEVFYKYVRDKVLPPDVNTSSEQMAVDYQVGKIRNKLSMISGLGSKAADKIIKHRPYSDIKDFVKKKPCGPSMTRKLIYVGALDSLFKDKQSVESKLELFEKTLKEVEFEDKLASYDEKIKAAKDGKEIEKIERNKARYEKKGPKPHEVDSKYFGLSPKKAFLMKKSIFPTMNLGLMDVLKKDSRVPLTVGKSKTIITDGNGRDQIVLDGEHLQRIDSSNLSKDAYFCVPGYVMDSSVFSYHKDTKRALKLIIDSSGYVSEKVIWPDYDIGELNYPKSLKKGCIAWFVYCKKAGKPYTNIIDITIEEKALD